MQTLLILADVLRARHVPDKAVEPQIAAGALKMVHQHPAVIHAECQIFSVLGIGAVDVALTDAHIGRRRHGDDSDNRQARNKGCNDRLHLTSKRPAPRPLSRKSPAVTMRFRGARAIWRRWRKHPRFWRVSL